MAKIVISLFYFVFGFMLLFFAAGTKFIFGSALALPASFFLLVGIVMVVRLYQLWRRPDAFSKSIIRLKNIIPFLLLLILGVLFLDGLFSILQPSFIEHSKAAAGELVGGLAALFLSSILMGLLFRRIFRV